ncbi:MAG: ribonuclease HI [Chloroflexi bacterium]|nr:ribonuclease HI [Chloroflexota bacterium]
MKRVTIYTDGACIGNPGPGGYGAVIMFKQHRKEISSGFRKTTNNRMEILAAIRALETLTEPCEVTLHSDSAYLVNAMMQGWAERWKAQGWKRGKQGKAANPDLWEILLNLAGTHRVTFKWVPGHKGILENERCDALANAAARGKNLPVDEAYEKSTTPT